MMAAFKQAVLYTNSQHHYVPPLSTFQIGLWVNSGYRTKRIVRVLYFKRLTSL